MRESWTDTRLSDFAARSEERFAAIDRRFDAVDQRFDSLEHRVDEGFTRVDAEIRGLRTEMNARFDAMQRTMIQSSAIMVAALIGLIATQL